MKGFSPQVSLNFGSRRGYSYVSGGIGTMTRAIDATEGVMLKEVTGDTHARTLNYGGGARWFVNSRVAFSFDMRFYRVAAQDATDVQRRPAAAAVFRRHRRHLDPLNAPGDPN